MNIEVNDFNGPLDLLLHLIKTSKMDIYDIDIKVITKEYIDYINNNKELTIDACSEYLVMASELIHLKSKQLLNKNNEEEETEYEINNEEELRNRLLEYQKIKEMASDFRELETKRGNVYTKLPENLNEFRENKELNSDITLDDLLSAFEEFLKRKRLEEPLNTKVTKRELSVEERIKSIRQIIKVKGKVNFLDLFDDISKPYVIITFLSILNMTKNKEIKLSQTNNFGEIYIEGSTL
ncbi:segregation/condensation protein A [bacterium]|nr:segregation/condensation protein A [bacterium]MDY3757107.1 segregation/condensation protein A [Bacilli bacterium]